MTAPINGGWGASGPSAEHSTTDRRTQGRHAAGIYGLIVTAAVLASAGGHLRTVALELAVFVTLLVYWLAEEYAQLVEHASAGHLPNWPHVRSALAAKWPMVSASYLPLLTLIGARLVGVSTANAAYAALAVTVAMLIYYGWSAGRASGLRGTALVIMTTAAGALGMMMILLKVAIVHLH